MIFDKFYRGKLARPKVQGTGMGLAIAKAILIVHGGGIAVKSKVGEGSTFDLHLLDSGGGEACEQIADSRIANQGWSLKSQGTAARL